jgi:hypothetical protein
MCGRKSRLKQHHLCTECCTMPEHFPYFGNQFFRHNIPVKGEEQRRTKLFIMGKKASILHLCTVPTCLSFFSNPLHQFIFLSVAMSSFASFFLSYLSFCLLLIAFYLPPYIKATVQMRILADSDTSSFYILSRFQTYN